MLRGVKPLRYKARYEHVKLSTPFQHMQFWGLRIKTVGRLRVLNRERLYTNIFGHCACSVELLLFKLYYFIIVTFL